MAISLEKKVEVVKLIIAGHSWIEAAEQAEVQISESTAYRWHNCWQAEGQTGLIDKRHGYIYKMTPEIRVWLKEYCEHAPHTPSREVRKKIKDRFGVKISRGHINRVRAELGVSRPKKNRI
jgi:transposase